MFDLGIQELIVIFIVALVVFGPDKLPEVGKVLGKGLGDLQRALRGAKDELDAEVNKVKDEIKDPLELKNQLFSSNDLFSDVAKNPASTEETAKKPADSSTAAETKPNTEHDPKPNDTPSQKGNS
ncbi:MAG TPA: twin-arginine translocase TatA/TatE family subunit [Dissulfurispiraceae bacterium]|nr:twin-arginine translocase TatA/TatE family subunit [Dissulfurispiraceae bacterium]